MAPTTRSATLSAAVRERAFGAAVALGERLLTVAESQHPADDDQWFVTRSLAGSPGYALAFMALWRATGQARFESAMHAFIRKAAAVHDRPDISLYGGIGGLRAVVALATAYEPRYVELLEQCDAFIDARIPREPVLPSSFGAFDLIAGWSGARLARCVERTRPPDGLTDSIAWVLEDDERWCCVHPVRGGEPEHDLGMAHGVAGMLAALVLTLDDIEPYRAPIECAAADLAGRATDRSGVLLWSHSRAHDDNRLRAAWCYGTPGVAAALHSCALATGNGELASFAVHAAESLALVPSVDYLIDEPNLCHGTLGNALCIASIAASAQSSRLDGLVERYVMETVDQVIETRWRCMARNDVGERIDLFDELSGSAGIVLGLLTLCGAFDPAWLRLHGLRPIS